MRYLSLLIFVFFFNSISLSQVFDKIIINGNKRISDQSIKNTIKFDNKKNYSLEEINNFQKLLFETSLFEDVKITFDSNSIKISVKENPIIDFFYIKGVENKSREDFIYENISLNSNKIFSKSLLKKDIEFIKKTFIDSGFLDVQVKTEISEIKNNVLNIVIDVDRKEEYKVNRVYFIGNKFFSSSKLSDVILSSEDGWWKFLSPNTNINQNRVIYDQFLLKNYYLNNGFYDVQITSVNTEIVSKNLANIIFSINSGEIYNYGKKFLIDNQNLLSPEQITKVNNIIDSKLSGIYSKKKISFVESEIYNYLNLNKIEFVKFSTSSKKNSNNNIDITYNFIPIDRKFVNKIDVTGNSITEENVVRRNLILSNGDNFTEYKLKKSKDNLENTGIFENIKFETTDSGSELVDINISVEEKPTGSISAGLGVGTSGSAVSGGVNEKNLFGKGINVNSNLSLGTEKISGFVGFDLPDYNNTGNTLNYNIYARSTDYTNAGYESSLAGTSASIKYPIYEDVFFRPGLGFEHDKINTNSTASSLYKSREGNYSTVKTFYNLDFDNRNSKFRPTAGHKVGFGQTLAIPGSDITHLENNVYGSYYKSLSKDYTLSLKGGVNTINSLENKDVKLSDRLFLTNSTLRGFESYGIGPKDGKDHIGGNYSFYSSLSSTVPNFLPEKWNANTIVFLDTGNVWGVDFDDSLDKNKLRSSTGVTLDWISPLGPISFTLSETISSASGDLEENFSFKIGSSF